MNPSRQRKQSLTMPLARTEPWDMLVIGGGITGAGIAREAARRGLAVLVVDQKDFAWGTSSRSSKMVHGGLRYIASGDYKTTVQSVRERERFLTEASGLVNEMHYVMPHYKGKFPPPWVFNTLLKVYDKIAGKRYAKYFKRDAFLRLNPGIKTDKFLGASQFSDALTDDSRLVMRVLDEAIQDGAQAINYLKADSLINNAQGLVVGARLTDTANQLDTDTDSDSDSDIHNNTDPNSTSYAVYAKVVVNATGAWADTLRMQACQQTEATFQQQIRPSRGSHLVISSQKLPLTHAYTFLHPVDKRAVFVFPWEMRTVIGTTDLDHPPVDDQEVGITPEEVEYLLAATNALFAAVQLNRDDIISTWAGVRPLIAASGDGERVSPSKEKRDHSVWIDHNLVTVSGGKLTTFRLIALDVIQACQAVFALDASTQDNSAQPSPQTSPQTRIQQTDNHDDSVFSHSVPTHPKFATLPQPLQHRLQGYYGRQLDTLLELAGADELVPIADSNTLWAELRFSLRYEQVIHLDDLLLRRARIGLIIPNGAMTPPISERIQRLCQQELGWNDAKWQQEAKRYHNLWHRYYHLPFT